MLGENLKNMRKRKGLTQEELAIRMNVVRQTISKWEKGISVPDAQMLKQLSEIFDTEVSTLLGSPIKAAEDADAVAEQLSRINEQLANKNRRSRKIWKIVGISILCIILMNVLLVVAGIVLFNVQKTETEYLVVEDYMLKNDFSEEETDD